jgi:uncharacterized RmlC-like cupin family protein
MGCAVLPDDHATTSPEAGAAADRPALLATAGPPLLEEDGLAFWRGFDPATAGTNVFLARARADAGTLIPPHWHSQDTVAYLVDGRAVFRSGPDLGDVHEMAPGDWLFVPAGMVHVEQTPYDAHADFLYARDGGGGTTTYVDDEAGAQELHDHLEEGEAPA